MLLSFLEIYFSNQQENQVVFFLMKIWQWSWQVSKKRLRQRAKARCVLETLTVAEAVAKAVVAILRIRFVTSSIQVFFVVYTW